MLGTVNDATIMVTGGAGFIGSHTIETLLARGAQVVNLDALTYASGGGEVDSKGSSNKYRFVRGDIGDPSIVQELLGTFNPDIVLNLAAETHVDRSIDDAQAFVRTNVVSLNSLLQTCLHYWKASKPKRFCFVQMSTDEVFGSIAVGEFTEESQFSPNSPYAATKAAGDHLVRAFHSTYDLPTMTVRSTNAYGPRQFPEKFIPHMISTAMRGLVMPLYGDGTNVRDWLYVKDLADGIVLALENGKVAEAYNFSGRNERQNLQVIHLVCEYLDRLFPLGSPHNRLVKFVPDRPGHDARYAVSSHKAQRDLGWSPKTTFEEGLRESVNWYWQNPHWNDRIISSGYALERLGAPAEN